MNAASIIDAAQTNAPNTGAQAAHPANTTDPTSGFAGEGIAGDETPSVIVGAGAGLREVIELVEKVAPTDTPVLIEGETGSGKELVARLLHSRSRRARGPMLRVNCGAMPAELIDSELFGHERGSFTGASQTRLGWFERADGGTLFLDEVAELPLAAQVRLLRVLQEGTLERVGGGKNLQVDVRVVTATHRDLRAMCERGEFRYDLFYRINVFSVRIPPLRERLGDIPTLATHFAQAAGLRLTGVPLTPSTDELAALLRYSWPGNVRELAAVIDRAAILGRGRHLEIVAALGTFAESARPVVPAAAQHAAPAVERFPTLTEVTRRHVEEALALSRGRIEGRGGAADLLGINPHTLRGKMRKLGVDWGRYRTPRG
jgi:hydrogenase-4 transcriptional activator